MSRSGSDNRQRETTLSARFNSQEADAIRLMAQLPRLAMQMRDLAQRIRPDLVYINGPRLLPAAALAQSNDATYCSALADKYQRYVGQNETRRGARNPDAAVNNAIADCTSGKAASAIPVLQKALQDAKVELPPRG